MSFPDYYAPGEDAQYDIGTETDPWHLTMADYDCVRIRGGGWEIATVVAGGAMDHFVDAHAALFLSAPTMLEALKAIAVQAAERDGEIYTLAMQALQTLDDRKAEVERVKTEAK